MADKLGTILARSLRLRCPVCGQGRLFRHWFRMEQRCSNCGFQFERAPGYFLGSIFVNYAVTGVIVTLASVLLLALTDIPPTILLWSTVSFAVLFPLWFFRYARAIWLGIDLYFDPAKQKEHHLTAEDAEGRREEK
jgi:uncharacterized protein (DUF983 family)